MDAVASGGAGGRVDQGMDGHQMDAVAGGGLGVGWGCRWSAVCVLCVLYVLYVLCVAYTLCCVSVYLGGGTAEAGCGVRGELCVLCVRFVLCNTLCCVSVCLYAVNCVSMCCVFWFLLCVCFSTSLLSVCRVPSCIHNLCFCAGPSVCALLLHVYHQHTNTFYAHTHPTH